MQQDISGSVRLVKRQVVKLMMISSDRSILFQYLAGAFRLISLLVRPKFFHFQTNFFIFQVAQLRQSFISWQGGGRFA